MSRTPRVGLVALLCVLVLVLAACGGDPPGPAPEITTGIAPTGQQPVSLKAYPAQSVGDGAEWPRACDLITRDEVLAVLPQATELELTGTGGGFDYELVGLGTYETPQAGGHYGRSRHIDIPEQKCEARMHLPSDADEDDIGVYASVQVEIDMVGSEDTVNYFYSRSDKTLPDSFGAKECSTSGDDYGVPNVSTIHCLKGEMSITVTGIIGGLEELPEKADEPADEDDPHVRLAGQPADTPAPQVYDWFRNRVVLPLVGVAARRMP